MVMGPVVTMMAFPISQIAKVNWIECSRGNSQINIIAKVHTIRKINNNVFQVSQKPCYNCQVFSAIHNNLFWCFRSGGQILDSVVIERCPLRKLNWSISNATGECVRFLLHQVFFVPFELNSPVQSRSVGCGAIQCCRRVSREMCCVVARLRG